MLPADSFDILHQPNIDLSDISMLLARIDFTISEMLNILQEIAVETSNHIKKIMGHLVYNKSYYILPVKTDTMQLQLGAALSIKVNSFQKAMQIYNFVYSNRADNVLMDEREDRLTYR